MPVVKPGDIFARPDVAGRGQQIIQFLPHRGEVVLTGDDLEGVAGEIEAAEDLEFRPLGVDRKIVRI